MIVDSSALLAIVLDEPEAAAYATAIAAAARPRMSVANWVESFLVVERRGPEALTVRLEAILRRSGMDLVPVSVAQASTARDAWRRFGRGRHRARLNYGDCFAYALAKTEGAPLLFKGEDFSQTDIEPALKA